MSVQPGSNLDICGGTLILSGGQQIDVSSGSPFTRCVVPFIGSMYADASGTVGVLKQQVVTITDIDEEFNITLSAADAVKVLNLFKVEDVDVSGAAFGASGETARIQVRVDASGSADFKTALMGIIDSTNISNGTLSLYNWLKAEARRDTVTLLSYDTLGNMLEASDLTSFDIDVDASGAAADLHDKMRDASDNETGQKRLNALFLQLPRANVEAYLDVSNGQYSASEPVKAIGFLPLVKNDKITFVFDATVGTYTVGGSAPSTGATITPVGTQYDNSVSLQNITTPAGSYQISNGGQYSTEAADLIFSKPSRRRVALTLRMTADSGAFNVSCAGVKEPAIYNSTTSNLAKLTA